MKNLWRLKMQKKVKTRKTFPKGRLLVASDLLSPIPPSAANGTSSSNNKSVVAQTAPASSNGSSSKIANLAASVTATKGSLVG